MSTIVVADDEVKIGQLLQRMLEGRGHTVRTATNTDDAWMLITQQPPDLLITDLKLPPADGVALMRQVHATYPHIPVLMITGYDDSDTEAKARAAGAKGFCGKPLDLNEICATIAQLLGS